MKIKHLLALLALLAGAAGLRAQNISVLVSSTNGLNGPYAVAVDLQNNYYISDSGNNRILVYTPGGSLTNLAGSSQASGAANGPGVVATFSDPTGVAFARGGLVVADTFNQLIRFIGPNTTVSTLAGQAGVFGTNDGPSGVATFDYPTGLAADKAGNIYITDVLTGRLRMLNLTNGVTTIATGFYRPQGVAVDPAGNIYVADTGNNAIKMISGGTVTLLAGSGTQSKSGFANALFATNALFNKPSGLLWLPGTGLIVSDTGNGVLRLVSTNAQFGGYSVSTFFANPALAQPAGLASDIYGNIVVADGLNNSVDALILNTAQTPLPINPPEIGYVIVNETATGPSTQLIPVSSQVFNNDIVPAILPESGGVQTFYTIGSSNLLTSAPASAASPFPYADGDSSPPNSLFTAASAGPVVNLYAISIAPGTGRQPSPIVYAQFTYQAANPIVNGTDPSNFSVSETTAGSQLVYTTDGSDPTNSPSAQIYNLGQNLNILNGTNDVVFQIVATRQGYLSSTVISNTFHFSDVQTSTIGLTHNFVAGPGATLLLPIQVKMSSTNTLASLQYVVNVAANGGSPLIPAQLAHIPITTNDFVTIPTVATNLPQTSVYTNGTVTSISITYAGGATGFSVNGEQTVAHVAVPIPANAAYGQTYTVTITAPSGTSDARQSSIFLTPFGPATITVANTGYIVGDTAPGNFYNARDFGNGLIDNADVNNAVYASLGLLLPPNFTDVFDAMDAFPVDQPGIPGGDGQIRFLDWQTILNRSLGQDTNNWVRGWVTNPGGVPTRTNAPVTLALAQSVSPGHHSPVGLLSLAKAQGATPGPVPGFSYSNNAPGAVWLRQGAFGVTAPAVIEPGQTVSVPVWVKLMPGCSLSGAQFGAALVSGNGSPGPALAFSLAPGLPTPQSYALPLSPNTAAEVWPLNSFSPGLTGSNVLGSLTFTVPTNAAGTYAILLLGDGAPVEPSANPATWVGYNFENFKTVMGIGGPAPTPPSITSETWKTNFFGANYATNALALDTADPDGDGVPNWMEYLAGTDPTNPKSFLSVHGSLASSQTVNGSVMSFLSAPGKVYALQSTPQLGTPWTTLPGTIVGNGDVEQLTDTSSTGGNTFYRVVVVPQ